MYQRDNAVVPQLRRVNLDDPEEAFMLAMHYMAGTAFVLGVQDEALAVMRELIERATKQNDKLTAPYPYQNRE